MSYIESHQELEGHFKLLDLQAALGLDINAAIGLLHRFWWWSMTYAETGLLAKHPPARLDAKFGKGFVEAMMTAGFIDRNEYRIHNWGKRAGRYLLTRYRTRQPLYVARIFLEYGMRDEAEALLTQAVNVKRVTKAQADQALGGDGPPLDAMTANDEAHEKKVENGQKTAKNPCETAAPFENTPENRCESPAKLKKDGVSSGNSTHLNLAQPSAAQPNPSTDPSSQEAGEAPPSATTNDGFDAIWQAYPRPTARKAAQRAWEKLAPDAALRKLILDKIAAQKLVRAARSAAGLKFTPEWPNLSTYISGERWEDVILPPDPGSPAAIAGPPQGERYAPTTPLQCLICVYKMLKGVEMEDRGWDASNWRSAEPNAVNLLKAFDGDDKSASSWLEAYSQEMRRGSFDNWTLRSAAERAWNTKGARLADRPIELNGVRGGETLEAAEILREKR